MGKILRYLPIFTAAVLACAFAACNTSGCTDNRSSIPLARFYSSSSLKEISLDSLEITGVGAPDSAILVVPGTKVSEIHLPMRATAKTTAWCFAYHWADLDSPANNDTISFSYDAEPYFASDECGAMYRYRITDMTHTSHLIDSVALVSPLITNIDDVDIRIYFRTAEETPANARSSKPSIKRQ